MSKEVEMFYHPSINPIKVDESIKIHGQKSTVGMKNKKFPCPKTSYPYKNGEIIFFMPLEGKNKNESKERN